MARLSAAHAELLQSAGTALAEGAFERAERSARELIADIPHSQPALQVLAAALLGQQRAQEALATVQRALELSPDNLPQLINQALALQQLGRHEEALRSVEAALRLEPALIEGHVNQSAILLTLERHQEALEATLRGLALAPEHPPLLLNRITALLGLERYAEALQAIDATAALHGESAELALDRMLALSGLHRHADALRVLARLGDGHEHFQMALELVLEQAEPHLDEDGALALLEALADTDTAFFQALGQQLVKLFIEQGRFASALAACRHILCAAASRGWSPKERAPLFELQATALALLLRFEESTEAVGSFSLAQRAGLSAEPLPQVPPDQLAVPLNGQVLYANWHLQRTFTGRWDHLRDFERRYPALAYSELDKGRVAPLAPFHSLLFEVSPALQQRSARAFASGMKRVAAAVRPTDWPADYRLDGTRLRIGYVSADFRYHATAHLTQGLFERHDRQRFEVFAYSLHQDDGSAYRQRIAAGCDHFVELQDLGTVDAARRIQADGIHILVDLMGYTHLARPEIFALRPAPLQVNFLGYPGTLGADFIDYIIADATVLPEPLRPYFDEAPVYMPDTYQVTDRQTIASLGLERRTVGLPDDAFVFCCFNGPKKLRPEVFDVWMRLLQRLPHTVLWLFCDAPKVEENLRRAASERGVEPQRVLFSPPVDKAIHLERMALADLFLDTFIYTAHTTASDALWAGLPVLTLCGERFQSRVAASLLKAVGLPELITYSVAEYERRAEHLAIHPEELRALKTKLQANRLSHPLFDTDRFVRNLERGYEAMWARYQQGAAPQAIHL
ncbi:MAG TPA: glycosyltransferase [Candidatus Competibacteraceae bacterium]|nr:glycosyltransferase [Candidatus Competibacteraceae bacterium]